MSKSIESRMKSFFGKLSSELLKLRLAELEGISSTRRSVQEEMSVKVIRQVLAKRGQ